MVEMGPCKHSRKPASGVASSENQDISCVCLFIKLLFTYVIKSPRLLCIKSALSKFEAFTFFDVALELILPLYRLIMSSGSELKDSIVYSLDTEVEF